MLAGQGDLLEFSPPVPVRPAGPVMKHNCLWHVKPWATFISGAFQGGFDGMSFRLAVIGATILGLNMAPSTRYGQPCLEVSVR